MTGGEEAGRDPSVKAHFQWLHPPAGVQVPPSSGSAASGARPADVSTLLSVNSSLVNEKTEARREEEHAEWRGQGKGGALHTRGSEKTATPSASGSRNEDGGVVAWGRAGGKGPPSWAQKPKLHSKCAHASQRREPGSSPTALPCPPPRPGWSPLRGVGLEGVQEACRQPILAHPRLSFSAVQVAGAWGGVPGQQGGVWGGGEAASVPPLYRGVSLQRTISRSLR